MARDEPPATLAAKLGITATTRVVLDGAADDEALAEALAAGTASPEADLVVLRVDDADALAHAASRHAGLLMHGVPLWVVYPKGKAAPLGESAIRAMLRARGFMDVKVASVSPALSALKFVRRREAKT